MKAIDYFNRAQSRIIKIPQAKKNCHQKNNPKEKIRTCTQINQSTGKSTANIMI